MHFHGVAVGTDQNDSWCDDMEMYIDYGTDSDEPFRSKSPIVACRETSSRCDGTKKLNEKSFFPIPFPRD